MALPKSLQPPKKSQLANAASGGGGTGGTPPVDPYTAQAMAEIQPIIDQLSAQANQQAASSSTAIQGLTDSYAKQLAGLNIGAPSQNAESGQAAVDAALQQSLTGSGSSLASGLASELSALKGSSGEGALNSAASQLASLGASGGTSRLASGSASLGNLIADAAAAETYGKKLPGIADLAGIQGVKQAEGNAQQTIAKGTTALLSQLPGVEQQLRSDKLAQQSLKATKAYRSAELGLSSWKARVSAAQGQARIGIAQQNANTSASRAAQTAFNENRSYGLSLSRLGIEGKRLQLEAIRQEGLLRSGGLSPSEVSRYKSVAFGIATHAFASMDTQTNKPVTYQAALSEITQKGVPVSIAARMLHNAGFKPGVRGTPLGLSPAAGKGSLAGNLFSGLSGLGQYFTGVGGKNERHPFGAGGDGANFQQGVETAVGNQIVKMARGLVGTPYVWGGESSKGFDCSGFAQYLYGKLGVQIPRTSYDQWLAPNAHPVQPAQLKPGDLVFYKGSDSIIRNGRLLPGHVGVYIGGGKVINAYGTGYGVRIDNVNSPALGGYMGARRYK